MVPHLIITWIGISTAAIFLSMSALHVYWACGSSAPSAKVIPTRAGRPLVRPTPAGTLLVALALLLSALVVLAQLGIGQLGLPVWIFRTGTWALAALFLLRAVGDFRYMGFFKQVRDTPFARNDTRLLSPLCMGIAASCAMVAAFG